MQRLQYSVQKMRGELNIPYSYSGPLGKERVILLLLMLQVD
jgi:hypothetical protein